MVRCIVDFLLIVLVLVILCCFLSCLFDGSLQCCVWSPFYFLNISCIFLVWGYNVLHIYQAMFIEVYFKFIHKLKHVLKALTFWLTPFTFFCHCFLLLLCVCGICIHIQMYNIVIRHLDNLPSDSSTQLTLYIVITS